MPRLDVGDTVAAAFRTVAGNLGVFLRVQGPFVVAVGVLGAAGSVVVVQGLSGLVASLETPPGDAEAGSALLRALATSLLPFLPFMAVSLVIGTVGTFFGALAVEELRRGGRPTLSALWMRGRPRFAGFFATAVLSGGVPFLVVMLGFLPLLAGPGVRETGVFTFILGGVAAVYLGLTWYLAPALALFDPRGLGDNFARSSRLASGRRLGVALILLVIAVAAEIADAIVAAPFGFLSLGAPGGASAIPSTSRVVAESLVSIVPNLFFGPVYAAALTLVYFRSRPTPPAAAVPPAPLPAPGNP